MRISDFSDITLWDVFGCAKVSDVGALKLTKNNAAITYMNTWIRPSYNFNEFNYLQVMVYVADLTNFLTLGITFHSTAGDAVNYIGIWVSSLAVGWNKVVVKKSDFTAFGSGTWSTVAEIRLTVNFDTDAITRVFEFDNMKIYK